MTMMTAAIMKVKMTMIQIPRARRVFGPYHDYNDDNDDDDNIDDDYDDHDNIDDDFDADTKSKQRIWTTAMVLSFTNMASQCCQAVK